MKSTDPLPLPSRRRGPPLLLCLCLAALAALLAGAAADAGAAAGAGEGTAAALSWDPPVFDPQPSTANCTQLWMEQPADHFDYGSGAPTWRQRYYACESLWRRDDPLAPVLFYAGNESPVPSKMNNTGLMWQLAEEMGALLVFAEHRYYGESMPLEGDPATNATALRALSIQQALADYVNLLQSVKRERDIPDAPVIAFGGSYGANLAAWLRMHYPQVVFAALASSAPLRCQLVGGRGWAATDFWAVVTRTASPEAGASPACVPNSRAAFAALFALAETPEGRTTAEEQLGLCPGSLRSAADARMVALWLRNAWDEAAMSSTASPSSYFTGDPAHPLPAWPVRVMCEELAGELQTPEELLAAMGRAASLYWNVSGGTACYDRDSVRENALQTGSAYMYQCCSEWVPNETFFPSNASSMFWDEGATDLQFEALDAACESQYGPAGPTPDFDAVPWLYGVDPGTSSRIILWNGLLDSWSSGGILTNQSESVVALVDPNGGHHADLSWSTPADLASLNATRVAERALLLQWLEEYRAGAGVDE